jgi:hypothetical protein
MLLNIVVPIVTIAAAALMMFNAHLHRRQWAPLLILLVVAIVVERALWFLYPVFGPERTLSHVWWLF